MASATEDFVRIGVITKPHGIKGEVIVFLESDFPKWVAKRETIYLEANGAIQATDVLQARFHQGKLVLKLAAITDRNAAEASRGWPLYVPEAEAREPFTTTKDHYLNSDLLGLVMYDERAPEQALGEVIQIYELPKQELIEIRKPDGSTFLVPFVAAIVTEVMPESGRIMARLPEGLDTLDQEVSKES